MRSGFFFRFGFWGFSGSRDETFAKVSNVHRTIFDYVMLIFDGFKGVIEDVSLLFDPRGGRLLLIYALEYCDCYERKL